MEKILVKNISRETQKIRPTQGANKAELLAGKTILVEKSLALQACKLYKEIFAIVQEEKKEEPKKPQSNTQKK